MGLKSSGIFVALDFWHQSKKLHSLPAVSGLPFHPAPSAHHNKTNFPVNVMHQFALEVRYRPLVFRSERPSS